MTPTLDELTARIELMAPAARAKLLAQVGKSMARHIWMPLPGPQTMGRQKPGGRGWLRRIGWGERAI